MANTASAKIPTTVITGFLGAGKTTLIRHLLENAKGRRLALIINEFGDVGVDGELVKGCNDAACPEEDIVELANGCICCTVADDFLPTMTALLDRPSPPDHIIIETSGLALPKPLVKAFQWPDIRTRATVDGVVALIDADAVAAVREVTPVPLALERLQRYSPAHLSATGAAARLPVSGLVRIANAQAWLRALPQALPVRLHPQGDGGMRVEMATGAPA